MLPKSYFKFLSYYELSLMPRSTGTGNSAVSYGLIRLIESNFLGLTGSEVVTPVISHL